MPAAINTVNYRNSFECHGMDMRDNGSGQAVGDCFICGKEDKIYLSPSTGLWDCKSCFAKGNIWDFLRKLWKASLDFTTVQDYKELAQDRKIINPGTLKTWGCVKSVISGEWLVPGYNLKGALCQLYRYSDAIKKGETRKVLYATHGIGHYLHGVHLFNDKVNDVYICEGPWDAMALWEVMRSSAPRNGVPEFSINPQLPCKDPNLLTSCNVLAVPGANVFPIQWVNIVGRRNIYLMYDSDKPKVNPNTKRAIPNSSPGYQGMKRVYSVMTGKKEAVNNPPSKVMYLNWGDGGYAHDKKDGYDVRDYLVEGTEKSGMRGRVERLSTLHTKLVAVPLSWDGGSKNTNGSSNSTTNQPQRQEAITSATCTSWEELETACRKAMKWTPGLKHGFSSCLAVIMSTNLVGDQVWIKLISPPSTGKTDLIKALAVNKNYTHSESNITGFHSGFRTRDGRDHSLLAKMKDKTLLTKDGDTLMTMPNLDKILAEARDIYDISSSSHYKHGGGRSYEGHRSTWIVAGTEQLITLDHSEVGQRMLTVVIMDKIDDDLEDEIARRKINLVFDHRAEANCKLESQHSPEQVEMMRLTGGYIDYIRQNSIELYKSVKVENDARDLCIKLGKFVSYMRARPPQRQDEVLDTREMSARLVSQHGKMCLCLAAVLGKREVDREVLEQLTSIAFDTARGKTLDVVRHLIAWGNDEGLEAKVITSRLFLDGAKGMNYLKFLRRLGVLEMYTKAVHHSNKGVQKWRVSGKMVELYEKANEYYRDGG